MLGIIGAMDVEVAGIKKLLKIDKEVEKASLVFYIGKHNNCDIVLVRSGIGKVNASMCAQILIDYFHVDKIINVGVAGGMANCLEIGDIVVSTDLIQHDFDTTDFGYEPGAIAGLDIRFFEADKHLIEAATKTSLPKHKIHKGRIASGDQFISKLEQKHKIIEMCNAYACEMEGAAIAHVCHLNKIPFVVIRSISDTCDTHQTYEEMVEMAAENSTQIILSTLNNL